MRSNEKVSARSGSQVTNYRRLDIYSLLHWRNRLAQTDHEVNVAPGPCEARLSSGALPAGVCFLHLDAPGFRSVKKAVVAR